MVVVIYAEFIDAGMRITLIRHRVLLSKAGLRKSTVILVMAVRLQKRWGNWR
ncbi:hypothetical protein [Escherichia coli]|uniref:hypothetical protein n=1 Tax=Escherichia coli TaxID=562 RepID=UPI002032D7BD|nr:hypothetical protein [Escherichia coli]